jgi:hypothetical protein
VRYSELRSKISTGDILSCAGSSWFSRLIRFKTRQSVSHVGLAVWVRFENGKRRLCIFEAVEGHGVRLQPLCKYLETEFWNKNAKMWWQPIIDPKIKGDQLLDFCLTHWSDRYASPYQFIIGLFPLLQWLRKFLGKSLDDDARRWHCAELISNAFKKQGYFLSKEPAITSPGDVTDFSCLSPPVLIEESLNEME